MDCLGQLKPITDKDDAFVDAIVEEFTREIRATPISGSV